MADAPGSGLAARLAPSAGRLAFPLVLVVLATALDAMLRTRGDLDYRIIRTLRDVDLPGLESALDGAQLLSAPVTLVAAWAGMAALLLVGRHWLASTALAMVPLAAFAAWALSIPFPGQVVDLGRIDAVLGGVEVNGGRLFPPEIAAMVVLYGLGGFVYASLLPRRRTARFVSLVVLLSALGAIAGSVFAGEMFLLSAIGAVALGGLVLLGSIHAYRVMAPTTARVPLVHATYLDQPGERGAHALTSTILFRGDEVWKIYSPGFIPRFIYWLAFQAPFGYSTHRVALEACIHRRNLAGKLTEYWFGSNRVSPALRIESIDGHLALVSHYARGNEPADHAKARAFLFDLAERFDAAGLPTWQIDPRQPRSLGNALEGADGEYTIIDLESGLVSPMASPRAWWRAVRRAQFPFYDDVAFDVTRAYVDAEEAGMLAKFGLDWVAELRTVLDEAERTASEWHKLEPRIWSRLLRWLWSGFGIPGFPRWLHEKAESSEHHAIAWVEEAIDTWEREGRITAGEARSLKQSAESDDVQAVMPHFGVHLVIGVALRFPFGSITRATYSLLQLGRSTVRFLFRRIDLRTFRRNVGIHSPIVIVAAALPGVGTFAYLLSWPLLSRFLLLRVAADAVGEHLPFHIYRRLGAKRIVARPVRHRQDTVSTSDALGGSQ